MRTPLNAIVGMNDLLRDTPLSSEQSEMVKAMHEASRSMLKLIEDVLDISKIEAGKVNIEETDFDLHSLVNGTAGVLAPQAEIRGLQFRTHVMPEVPHALRGDPVPSAPGALQPHRATASSSPRPGSVTLTGVEPGRERARGSPEIRDRGHRHRHRARGPGAHFRELRRRPTTRPRGATAVPAWAPPSRSSWSR